MRQIFISYVLALFLLCSFAYAADSQQNITVTSGTNVVQSVPGQTFSYYNGASDLSTDQFYFNVTAGTGDLVINTGAGEWSDFWTNKPVTIQACFRYAGIYPRRETADCGDGQEHCNDQQPIACDGSSTATCAGWDSDQGSPCSGDNGCNPSDAKYGSCSGTKDYGSGHWQDVEHCCGWSVTYDSCNCDSCGGSCRGTETGCDGHCDSNDNSPFDEGGWSVYCAQCEVICPYACCPDPAPDAGDLCPYC